MDHAEAHERLSDVALEPARLAELADDRSPGADALRDHVASCKRCAADLAAWRLTWAQVGVALPRLGRAGDEASGGAARHGPSADPDITRIRAPASLRARTMAAVAGEGRPNAAARATSTPDRPAVGLPAPGDELSPPESRPTAALPHAARRETWAARLAVAAALVIAVGAGSLAWARTSELDQARTENAALTSTAATLDRVLATPSHWVVTLRATDGTAGGTVAWSAAEIVMITTALPAPSSGHTYRCWVESAGVRTPIGSMWFSGSTGYWAASMTAWGTAISPGARFGVSLVSDGGGEGTPVLVGAL